MASITGVIWTFPTPNCTVTGDWSSADDMHGTFTWSNPPSANPVNVNFGAISFNFGGLFYGRINTVEVQLSFSASLVLFVGNLNLTAEGTDFDGHPNPINGELPVASTWTLDESILYVGTELASLISIGNFIAQFSTNAGGLGVGDSVIFTVTDYKVVIDYTPSALTSITPNHGPAAGGTPVTIIGDAFLLFPQITIGGLPLENVVYVDDQTITGTTPAHASGQVDVIAAASFDGHEITLTDGFTYGGQIDSVFLSHGAAFGDSLVNISGSGFVDGGTITNIYFGVEPATNIFVLNDGNVSCHTPAHALGSVFITIEFDNDPLNTIVSDEALFTYIEESWELEDPFEYVEIGDEVTVTSDDFDLSAFVPTMGGMAVTIITQTATLLVFEVPALSPGIYVILSGTVVLGTLEVLLVGNASGIYTLVLNKTNDTIYNNARDGTTQDVKIPNPFIKTGFIGG